jgi:hypothetical protein
MEKEFVPAIRRIQLLTNTLWFALIIAAKLCHIRFFVPIEDDAGIVMRYRNGER